MQLIKIKSYLTLALNYLYYQIVSIKHSVQMSQSKHLRFQSNLTQTLIQKGFNSSQVQAIDQIQPPIGIAKAKSNPEFQIPLQESFSELSSKKSKKRVPAFLKKSFIDNRKKPSVIQAQKSSIQTYLQKMLVKEQQLESKKMSEQERLQIQEQLCKVRNLNWQSGLMQNLNFFIPTMHTCQLCQNQSLQPNLSICNCEHKFCQLCLQGYLLYNINNMTEEIKCPEESCMQKFDESCQYFAMLPQKARKKYIKNKLWRKTLKNPDIRLCPRQQCQQGIINLKQIPPKCQKCEKTFCKQCELQSHQGLCEQNFQQLHQQWKRCPKCRVFIQKNEGCNHITCTCGYQFCYVCTCEWNDIHYGCGNPEYQQIMNLLQIQNLRGQLVELMDRQRMLIVQGPIRTNFSQPIIIDMTGYRRFFTAFIFIVLLPLLFSLMLASLAIGIVIGWVFLTLSIIPCAIKHRSCATSSDLKFIGVFPLRTMSQVYRFYVKYIIRCGKRRGPFHQIFVLNNNQDVLGNQEELQLSL